MSQVSIIDIEGNNPQIPTRFNADFGFAIPIANVLEILGTTVPNGVIPVYTTGSGNTITTNVQLTQAIAASDATRVGLAAFDDSVFDVDANGFVTTSGSGVVTDIGVDTSTPPGTNPVLPLAGIITVTGAQVAAGVVGANAIRTNSTVASQVTIEIQHSAAVALSNPVNNGVCHFNDADFSVDGNGFVSAIGTGGLTWQTISASQTLVINHGYMCISPGGALSLALPATATIGDTIEIVLDGATSYVITQSAGQQIRIGNMETTLGATGTLTTTAQGDWVRLVAQSATRWVVNTPSNLTPV